ncbi:MAG: DUF1028 domain-containing protein [Thermoplasmata archaeon]|nr:DUF1028 domain-containing protein [Thermoplasmata archaeon]MCI4340846.1 DUF1028 domain-containing protein [Thermoplasmata archaeon]
MGPRFGTFSIVAADPETDTWGVAVQSKFISVGAVVPWAEAKVGALATQAHANVTYGPQGLALLRKGRSASEVVKQLTEADPQRDHRQLGVVDRKGESASFTGASCVNWAGHVVGHRFACQGNILFGPAVAESMARSFERTPGDLPERLLAALSAGQREGGDRRGMQSAALLVVRAQGGYDQGSDRWVDIRVDEHPSPIEELARVFRIYDLTLLEREDIATREPIAGEMALRVQRALGVLGYYIGPMGGSWDAKSKAAYLRFIEENNFENKAKDAGAIWPSVLGYLEERAQAELTRRQGTAPVQSGALDRGPGAATGPAPVSGRGSKGKH